MKSPFAFMNRLTRTAFLVVLALAFVMASAVAPKPKYAPALISSAEAAVTNYSVASGQIVYIPLHITGTVSATVAGIAKWNMPMPCDLVGVGASAQAIVGATNTIDVKLGGVSVLSAPITIAAAGTYTEGTITTTAITDEGAITVDVNIVGTSVTHVTVFLTCVRK